VFISTHISFILLFLGSAEKDVRWGENLSTMWSSVVSEIFVPEIIKLW